MGKVALTQALTQALTPLETLVFWGLCSIILRRDFTKKEALEGWNPGMESSLQLKFHHCLLLHLPFLVCGVLVEFVVCCSSQQCLHFRPVDQQPSPSRRQ